MVKQADSSIDRITALLKRKYQEAKLSEDWKAEERMIKRMLEAIKNCKSFNYEFIEPMRPGSSGLVLKVRDRNLGVYRALKLPRPIEGKITLPAQIVKEEIDKLTHLNHQNIVKVYYIDQAKVYRHGIFPFFIMEYIEEAKSLETYVTEKRITIDDFAKLLKQILEALHYLRSSGIVHCDIKPANILVQQLNDKVLALISDLGYSKYEQPYSDDLVSVRSSFEYAPPVLRKTFKMAKNKYAVVSEVRAKDITFKLDLFMLGITVLKILDIILRNHERTDEYKKKYLTLIGARLLMGWDPSADQIPSMCAPLFKEKAQIIRGIYPSELSQLSYKDTFEALIDVTKFLDEYNLSESIPELNPLYPNLIQLPGRTKVPFTERLKHIIEHPMFIRLSNISQLGMVKLVYPGATHTRAEHCLGTFANACQYVAALYNNRTDPLFKSIMQEEDLEAVLLTALLHDIGQYPLAHDLEETDPTIFSHQKCTEQILRMKDRNGISKSVNEWKAKIDDVLNIIKANPSTGAGTIRDQILHTIIDGPIDADRMDYLYRDCVHLGVPYGLGIDFDRFLKTLSVAYGATDAQRTQRTFSIAISDKGRITAESIAFSRYAMYSAVYWQHTARALKAMLNFAVRQILNSAKQKGKLDEFQREHERYALRTMIHKGSTGVLSKLDNNVVAEIQYFQKQGQKQRDNVSKNVLQLILERKLYKRLFVISYPKSKHLFDSLLSLQQARYYDKIEGFRKYVQSYVRDHVSEQLRKRTGERKEQLNEFKSEQALILVDIPCEFDDEKLPYITERGESPDLEESIVWTQLHTNFNRTVGKIRILVHPDWYDTVSSTMNQEELKKLEQVMEAYLQNV